MGAAQDCGGDAGHRAVKPLVGRRAVKHTADEGFSRGADEDGKIGESLHELIEFGDQLEVLLLALAETDAWVDDGLANAINIRLLRSQYSLIPARRIHSSMLF